MLDSLILAVAVIHKIVLLTGKEQEKLNDWNSQWLQGCVQECSDNELFLTSKNSDFRSSPELILSFDGLVRLRLSYVSATNALVKDRPKVGTIDGGEPYSKQLYTTKELYTSSTLVPTSSLSAVTAVSSWTSLTFLPSQ